MFDADFAPIASNVTITPTNPTTNDNLVCNWVFSDPDNDAESNTVIKWFVNNAENSTFTNQTIINKSYTVKGQEWKCQVTPSDGLVFGTAVNSSAVVINNSPPLISTIYPNGGEKISGIITINASVSDADGQSDIQIVKFYYSNNSGSTFTLIGNDTIPSGGLYELTWNTSKVLDGKSYRIKIEAFDNSSATVAKISASNFAVNNVNEAPVVTVIAPNGGEVWNGSKSIKWNATDPDDDTLTIDIYYKNSSDANWAIIKAEEFNTGSYTWNTTSVPDGSTYLINVTAQDPGGYVVSDVSDNTFTIKNAVSGNNSSPGAGAAIPLIPTTPTNVTSAPLAEAIQEPLVNEAEQFFVSITPFAPAKFAPGLTGLAVSEITLKSKVNAESITAKIRKLESAPISIEDGEVYQYFELITEGLSARDLDKIIIKFKVPKSWADAHSTVYLATLVGTGWQKLPTTKTEEDSTTIEYLATTSHLSTFAIVGSTKTTVFAKIEVLYAIIGTLAGIIICVLFVLTSKRRRSKGSKPKMQLQQSHWPLVRPKEPKKPQSPYPKEVPDFGFC
ncbi:MAG: PGF-pre-PGF domain-containing protein [Candidatus Nanoarchaeia archaeon]